MFLLRRVSQTGIRVTAEYRGVSIGFTGGIRRGCRNRGAGWHMLYSFVAQTFFPNDASVKIRWKSNYPSVFYDRVFAKRETMAQLHRVANEWNIFPSPWKYTLLYGIQWDELMQMDCWPLSFGNPFRNLFNSLSKINPRAQNMSIRMEQKTTALRNRNTRRERKKEKNRTEGEREAHLIDALDRRSRSYRDRDTKIRGWTFDWWTDYISDPICIDYRGGRELPTILDVSIAIVRRVCTRSNADKIRRVNAIVFRKIDRGCCRFLCLI